MDQKRLMTVMGHIFFGFTALLGIIDILTINAYSFAEAASPYSIFTSRTVFITYQIWLIGISLICSFTLHKQQWKLFYIALMILIFLLFYHWIVSGFA